MVLSSHIISMSLQFLIEYLTICNAASCCNAYFSAWFVCAKFFLLQSTGESCIHLKHSKLFLFLVVCASLSFHTTVHVFGILLHHQLIHFTLVNEEVLDLPPQLQDREHYNHSMLLNSLGLRLHYCACGEFCLLWISFISNNCLIKFIERK